MPTVSCATASSQGIAGDVVSSRIPILRFAPLPSGCLAKASRLAQPMRCRKAKAPQNGGGQSPVCRHVDTEQNDQLGSRAADRFGVRCVGNAVACLHRNISFRGGKPKKPVNPNKMQARIFSSHAHDIGHFGTSCRGPMRARPWQTRRTPETGGARLNGAK